MPAIAKPGSASPRTGEQSLSPRMIPSIRYLSARENATGVGFGVGFGVGAGVATGVAVGSTEGDEDGDGTGLGDTAPWLGTAEGTGDGLGTGADEPHAARISVATRAVARTSLFKVLDSE